MTSRLAPRARLTPHGAVHFATSAVLLAVLGCGAGGCTKAQADHPHASNYALGDDDTYEKNPDVQLPREYWIVIRAESGSYAMLPRPDGSPYIVEECTKEGPLAALFANASLCESASSATLERINALTRSEAMQTSTFLHQKLRFVATEAETELGSARVEPHPHTDDLLAICKAHPGERNGTLRSVCDEELRYENADARPTIARRYTIEECRSIATRLNELYGIP